jgi:pantoate--beta-alanine ligase
MPSIIECSSIEAVRRQVAEWRDAGESSGFVPTMGYLHEGHLSLVRQAKQHATRVVASIFVNPTQFGPNEDLDAYPRDVEGDRTKLIEAHTDLLFLPEVEAIYPKGAQTFVEVKELARPLCGVNRPIHFQGVATVVTKLFHIVRPDVAVFGEKDFQQLALIKQMVRDLHMDIEVLGGMTVREEDGLAMSSRNAYLNVEQRQSAACLSAGIRAVRKAFAEGETTPEALVAIARQVIEPTPHTNVQYLELRDAVSLQQVEGPARETDRLFLAVLVGASRLIDNAPIGGDYPL